MRDSQKGFIVPVLLVIIVLLVVGSGVYVYKNKKAEIPVTCTGTQQTNTQTQPVNTQQNTSNPSPTTENKNGGSDFKLNSEILSASAAGTRVSYSITKNDAISNNYYKITLSCPTGVTATEGSLNYCKSPLNIIGGVSLSVKYKNSTSQPQVVTATAQILSEKDNKTVIISGLTSKSTIYPANSTPSKITVLFPNGGETYKIGDTVNITWNSSNLDPNRQLDVHLSNSQGQPVKLIANPPAGSTSFLWHIDSTVTGGSYLITVIGDSYGFNNPVYDRSDATFSVFTVTQ